MSPQSGRCHNPPCAGSWQERCGWLCGPWLSPALHLGCGGPGDLAKPWSQGFLHHGLKMLSFVARHEMSLGEPDFVKQEGCVCNAHQPHHVPPCRGNSPQHRAMANRTGEGCWHVSPVREGSWGKDECQWCLAMALVTMTWGWCYWVTFPPQRAVLTACPAGSRAGISTVSRGLPRGFAQSCWSTG